MKTAYVVLAALILASFSGCAARVWHPERFSTVEEAFSKGELRAPEGAYPQESVKRGTFRAPFEDVWRAASVSASQAQLNVEVEQKDKGFLLAMRTTQATPRPTVPCCQNSMPFNGVPQQRNYYYAIIVKELGPKSTEVTVIAKTQGRCTTGDCLGNSSRDACNRYASVHWATGNESTMMELNQILTFIRNNLIAAGLI